MYQNLKQIVSRRSGGIRKQSRGTLSRESLEIWLNGTNWPSKAEVWPEVVQTKPSKETKAKAKLVKEVFAVATAMKDTLHQV